MSGTLHGHIFNVLLLGFTLIFLSCKRGPKTEDPFSLEIPSDLVESVEDIRWAEHEVVLLEVLSTSNNLFLKVKEGKDIYWLATGLGTVKPGNTYFFNEAVVKHDFKSVELDREFDSVYLVTQLLPESRKDELKRLRFNPHKKNRDDETGNPSLDADQDQIIKVSIKELLQDPVRFENQRVEVNGTCAKVNAGIMGRNWIHLKPSQDDTADIVATSDALPRVGERITIQAIVRLEKDFGSGYSYPILLEEAILLE